MRPLFYLFICLSIFHLAHADSLVELMKKSKPKIKNEYPEYRDGGTKTSTVTFTTYRFTFEQVNRMGEVCGENEYGNDFTFTCEVKDPKNKKKFNSIIFSDLFKPEKTEGFNKLIQDSILAITSSAEYSELLEDQVQPKTIDSCGYSFTKDGLVVVFHNGLSWEKAARFVMKRDERDDYDEAYLNATRDMCSTGSFVIPWNIVAEYLKE